MTLDQLFDLRPIIQVLIKIRLQVAARRKDRIYFGTLVNRQHPDIVAEEVDKMLPPRRTWAKFRPRRKERAGLSSTEINQRAIYRATLSSYRCGELHETEWGRALDDFWYEMRQYLEEKRSLSPGRPLLIKKGSSKSRNAPQQFRLLFPPRTLHERVFLNIIARYLRAAFDDDLDSSVYAFRDQRGAQAAPIADLLIYRKRHPGQPLFAAEADIQSFFDTIGHPSVNSSVADHVEKARARGIEVDPRALKVIEQTLSSYSFQKSITMAKQEPGLENFNRHIATPPEALLEELREKYGANGFGLAQGGPLSAVLANLVLASADARVKAVPGSDAGFYARYCDDIVILHPSKDCCQKMLDEYLVGLDQQGLKHHAADEGPLTDRQYFDAKTLLPYRWGSNLVDPDHRTWISFLGYHIHHDGRLRLRRSTVRNEHDKQIQLVDRIFRNIDRQLLAGEDVDESIHVHFRAAMRLASMSVGRLPHRFQGNEVGQPCWSSAFPLLQPNRSILAQLRALDHGRERQLSRLRRGLARRGLTTTWPLEHEFWRPKHFTYLGAPFSYHAMLQDSSRPAIPDQSAVHPRNIFNSSYR